MRRRSEFSFTWALALAVLLHAAALLALARLPLAAARGNNLESLQVFDSRARVLVTPITLVSLDALRAPEPRPQVRVPLPAHQPPARSAPAVPMARVPRPTPAPTPAAQHARRRPLPAGTGRTAAPARGSGGAPGGGPLVIAPTNPGGAVPAPAAGAGGTPTGEVPGTGSGRGAGMGTGAGTGGSGGEGRGNQNGSDPPGAGISTGDPPADPKFTSRVADRAEPQVIRKGRLTYPEAAVADGVEGTCVLKVLVGEAGEVVSAEITRSSGDRRLDTAAVEYVRQWRYRPAVQDGQPRRVNTRATVQFALN